MTDIKEREIGELALFRGCRPDDIRWLARNADTLDVPAGQELAREGETVREFVAVVRGVLGATDGDGQVVLAPGAYYGEMGLIDAKSHPRTIETLAATRLLVFDPRAFRGMLERMPSVSRRLLGEMVARVRTAESKARLLAVAS